MIIYIYTYIYKKFQNVLNLAQKEKALIYIFAVATDLSVLIKLEKLIKISVLISV